MDCFAGFARSSDTPSRLSAALTLLASEATVRVVDGADELAGHGRSYDTGKTIEDPAHVEGLVAAARQANMHTGRDRLG